MHSSIFISSGRLKDLLLSGVLAVSFLVGAELYFRARGFTPQPNDDVDLWSVERGRANTGVNVLAIAGSSRFQAGLKLSVLRDQFPSMRVVQLSVSGGAPFSILRHLAYDHGFSGTVICEVIPHLTYTDIQPAEVYPGYSERPYSADVESWLRAHLKGRCAVFRPELSGVDLFYSLTHKGRRSASGSRVVQMDRQVELDFSDIDTVRAERNYGSAYMTTGRPLSLIELQKWISEVRHRVEKIQSRGGRVFFFQMPSSGLVRDAEERRFPDDKYFDVFRAEIGAPVFRFSDNDAMARFRCAEGSHLDRSLISDFTHLLCDEIVRRGLIDVVGR